MAKTDNNENVEVKDDTKNPLERPLEVTDSNKRSGKITSKLSDKIEKVEGNSTHDKIKLETADINLSATKVDMSSNSAANSFVRQSRYKEHYLKITV